MYDRAANQAATGEFEDATACRMLRAGDSSSGLSGSPVVPGHRNNMGGHTFRGQVCVLVPDGKIAAGMLAEFPSAEAFKIVIEPGAPLEHGLPESFHHRGKNLIVGGIADSQVESHPSGSGGLAFGDARFICLEDCLKVAGFGICPSLTGKASDLDLNDLPRLQEIASHASRDRCRQGGKIPGVRRMFGYEYALAVPDLDLSQQRKAMQHLTEGGTSDSKLTGQLALRRNRAPSGKARMASRSCCATTSVSFGRVAFLRLNESSRLSGITTAE